MFCLDDGRVVDKVSQLGTQRARQFLELIGPLEGPEWTGTKERWRNERNENLVVSLCEDGPLGTIIPFTSTGVSYLAWFSCHVVGFAATMFCPRASKGLG